MDRASLKRGFVAFALALALGLAPLASAEAFGPERGFTPDMEPGVEQPVERTGGLWSAVVSLWERISSVWGKTGADISPYD